MWKLLFSERWPLGRFQLVKFSHFLNAQRKSLRHIRLLIAIKLYREFCVKINAVTGLQESKRQEKLFFTLW